MPLPQWTEHPNTSDFGHAASYSLGDQHAAKVYYVSLPNALEAHYGRTTPTWVWECANPHLVVWAQGIAPTADDAKAAAEAAITSVLDSLNTTAQTA